MHYKPAEGDAVADRGVYMWGTDKNGATLNGAWHAFTGEDSYGKVFETTIDGAYDAAKIGVIVTTEGWDKVGGDLPSTAPPAPPKSGSTAPIRTKRSPKPPTATRRPPTRST